MFFDDLASAWYMDGHGVFVWSAYGLTAVVVLYLVLAPIRRYGQQITAIRADLVREKHRSDSHSAGPSCGEPLIDSKSIHSALSKGTDTHAP